jgi:hypothetical protein
LRIKEEIKKEIKKKKREDGRYLGHWVVVRNYQYLLLNLLKPSGFSTYHQV